MSATVISRLDSVARWEPDARGRLAVAALELYAERGYDRTTVADIAERAGVTERTFFRQFADKREALFDGSNALQNAVVQNIAAAPDGSPVDVAAEAIARAATMLDERRSFAQLRAKVIAANASLQERELLKLAKLGTAAADALRARGVADPAATLAAETAVTVFKVGFEHWIAADQATPGIADSVRAALVSLKSLTA